MKKKPMQDALMLEDFDIKSMTKRNPDDKVGVSVSRIYIQIAKYNFNPDRKEELRILDDALRRANNSKTYIDAKYIEMTLRDIMVCFGRHLRKLPKSTFMKI